MSTHGRNARNNCCISSSAASSTSSAAPNSRISARSISSASIRTTPAPMRLEGEGAADRRQRAHALFHRPPAPPARSRRRAPAGALTGMPMPSSNGSSARPRSRRRGTVGALVSSIRLARPRARSLEPPDLYDTDRRCRRSSRCGTGSISWCRSSSSDDATHRAKVLISRHRDGEINARRRREARHRDRSAAPARITANSTARAAPRAFTRNARRADEGYNVAHDRRRPEGRARRRHGRRQARAVLGAADLCRSAIASSRRIRVGQLGPHRDQPAVRPHGAWWRASRSMCRPTPTRRRWKQARATVEDELNRLTRRAYEIADRIEERGRERAGCRRRCAPTALLSAAAEPLAPLLLARRLRRGKELAERARRSGAARAAAARPSGPLVWLHGASVGELTSVLPLIERICARAASTCW